MLFKLFLVLQLTINIISNEFIIAIGFNVETVEFKNLKFQVWDLGGQTGIRYDITYFIFVLYDCVFI